MTVTTPPAPTPFGKGETATIGFWHNKNGQALIDSLNGGPTATNLGNWLASNFPYLYGGQGGAVNLAGKTNADVAALFLKDFSVTGWPDNGSRPIAGLPSGETQDGRISGRADRSGRRTDNSSLTPASIPRAPPHHRNPTCPVRAVGSRALRPEGLRRSR